ncbi:nucleoside hydrolase [Streptomyces sp. 7-21]|uniref:nucleoside hydrolase n=1 Tax=Streptomyces sp. 7-21 TaxID=2802283 RepID=UPI0035A81C72
MAVAGIGPLTNLAFALRRAPAWATAVRTVCLTAGNVAPHAGPEHNVASDVTAVRAVFGSGARVVDADVPAVAGEILRRIAAACAAGTA